jgi:hypothetical protein
MLLLFNGHAGAGLGQLFIAIGIALLSATVAIFWVVYRARSTSWLRIVGLFYIVAAVAQFAIGFILFPQVLLLLFWFILAGFAAACCLGLIHLIFRRRA